MKPVYRTLNGNADLPLMPPFRSEHLLNQCFPLVADLGCLRRFCDTYLNFTGRPGDTGIPEEVGRFEPLSPYVYLIACNHRHLDVARDRYGWFTQREMTFGFPVAWYRCKGGCWVVEGCAFVYPFVFLDSSLGLGTGRELQGWPKQIASFTGWGDGLLEGAPLKMTAPARLEAGPVSPRVVLEIEPPCGGFDPRASVTGWFDSSRAAWEAWLSFARNPAVSLQRSAAANPMSWWNTWRESVLGWRDIGVLTLKQFRDVETPKAVAYQGIVHSIMHVDGVNGLGPLSPAAQWMGDLSGGYRVRIHEYENQPIVKLLGLQVHEQRSDGIDTVATIRPLAPFWTDLNITYLPGDVLCWRSKWGSWRTPGSPGFDAPDPVAPPKSPEPTPVRHAPNPYNEVFGQANPCLPGPLQLRGATVRVLALRAERAALEALCAGYYAVPGQPPIEPVGDLVYLVAASGSERQVPDGPEWSARFVGFFVLVRRAGQLALINPFAFAGDQYAQITGRELHGDYVALSELGGGWFGGSDETFSRVRTMGFPVLHQGAEARLSTLVEIVPDPTTTKAEAAPSTPTLFDELGPSPTLRVIQVKQYRDMPKPELAAYQALVASEVSALSLGKPQAIHDPLRVRIHDDPTHPVARLLGLRPSGSEGPIELRPVAAVWASGELQLSAGVVLHPETAK